MDRTADVDEILASHRQKYKPTEVHKEIQPDFDLGNLLISDVNDMDTAKLKLVRESSAI